MRYRIGETPDTTNIAAGGDALLFAVVLGLLIGVSCAWLGWRGKQMWLLVWGIGLALISVGYMFYVALF